MSAAGLLIAAVLQSTLICLLAEAATLRPGRMAPALRHRLWATAVAMLLLVPPAWLVVPPDGGSSATAWLRGALAAALAGPTAPAAAGGALPKGLPAPFPMGGGPAEAVAAAAGDLTFILAAVWAAGAAAIGLRIALDQRAAHRLAAAANRYAAPATLSAAAPLRLSGAIAAPAAAGLLRPVILLPLAAPSWPRARLEAALAHESAHIRRRDLWTALAAEIACALYWFNPLVWRARNCLALEREIACDDEALCSGLHPHAYAAALLEVARTAGRAGRPAALAMADGGPIERRLLAILDTRAARNDTSRRARLLPLLAGAALIMPLAALRPAVAQPGDAAPANAAAPNDVTAAGGSLVDPRTERVPLPYETLAARAALVPATGRDGPAIALLKAELSRPPRGIDDLVRERSIWALSRVSDGRLLEPLLDDLRHRDWRVRAYAAWGLGVIASVRATAPLAGLLEDPVWRVRANAAFSLAQIGDTAARGAMAEALRDPAWQVRYAGIDYFANDPDPAQRERLLPLLRDPHSGTRTAAQVALASAPAR